MKYLKSIKNILTIVALLLATGWCQNLSAFTYANSDLLLVFRQDTKSDVEFNLGSVSNFLGQVPGTNIVVTNWSLSLVQANFGGLTTNVKFLFISATSPSDSSKRVWMTDGSSSDTPTDISAGQWSQLWSTISYVGSQAAAATATNLSSQTFVTNSTDASSYTQVASSGGQFDASTLSGASSFPIESQIPATNRFFELKRTSVNPKPAAALIGTFSLTSAGVLTFTAASTEVALTPSHIQSITRSGSQNSITFSTVSGINYRLHASSTFVSPVSTWPILSTVPASLAGNGSDQTLIDTTATTGVPQRFYAVEAYH